MEIKSQIGKRIVANSQLKYERERRGWTLSHVATLINCPDPHMIVRWERGNITPSPRYRQALCEIFGKDADELGFLSKEPQANDDIVVDRLLKETEQDLAFPRPLPPFLFNERLPHSTEFYGRSMEREILLNRTAHISSTSIVGSSRVGKTWLINYLLLEAKTQLGPGFRIGYLDATMASCSTVAGFTAKAAKALGVPLSPEQSMRGLVALEDVVDAVKAKGHHPVLCIDEFEGITSRRGSEFDVSFFAGLRALAQFGICLIVVSRHPLIDIVRNDGNTRGFFNIFEQLTLEPFDREDAEKFVNTKSALVGFHEREQRILMEQGKLEENLWPPIRLQLVGKMLLKEKEADKLLQLENQDCWQKWLQHLEEIYRVAVY